MTHENLRDSNQLALSMRGEDDSLSWHTWFKLKNGEIVIRPMMYLALSYDHRLIDGRDAVQFLVSIKQDLEDPSRLLIGL